LLDNWLIPSDLVKRFTETLTNRETAQRPTCHYTPFCQTGPTPNERHEHSNILSFARSIGHFTWTPSYVSLLPATQICYKGIAEQHLVFSYSWQCHAAQQQQHRMHCFNIPIMTTLPQYFNIIFSLSFRFTQLPLVTRNFTFNAWKRDYYAVPKRRAPTTQWREGTSQKNGESNFTYIVIACFRASGKVRFPLIQGPIASRICSTQYYEMPGFSP
jgi:hypothetical protein